MLVGVETVQPALSKVPGHLGPVKSRQGGGFVGSSVQSRCPESLVQPLAHLSYCSHRVNMCRGLESLLGPAAYKFSPAVLNPSSLLGPHLPLEGTSVLRDP